VPEGRLARAASSISAFGMVVFALQGVAAEEIGVADLEASIGTPVVETPRRYAVKERFARPRPFFIAQ